MKIQIENLKAQMQGFELNIHQRADALIEFNKLVEYTENLESEVENLRLFSVSPSTLLDTHVVLCKPNYLNKKGHITKALVNVYNDKATWLAPKDDLY